jgi:adenosylcobyric acid synthase
VPFKGYEMHVGRTTGDVKPLLQLDGHDRGADGGQIVGCYIHGLLADDRQRRHWLKRLGARASSLDYQSEIETTLDQLADHLEKHIDCDRLLALARPPRLTPAS